MYKKYLLVIFSFCVLGTFISCKSKFEKIQRSKDFAFKLQKADEYYEKKQWSKANTLYEELMTIYKGTKNFESIYYKYAYTFFNLKSYLPASYHFKNFADLFPKSDKAEETEYLNSLCLYYLSPDYTLDQSNTVKSISEMQTFINNHPKSKHSAEANKMIDESRAKLEKKDRYAAELYMKISEFKAASVAFEQLMRKYPDSHNADYYQYMIVNARYMYARNSILSKQEERYIRAQADYNDFVRKFPKSTYRNDVERINSLSLQALKKISKQ